MDNSNTCAFGKHVTSVFSDLFFSALGERRDTFGLRDTLKTVECIVTIWSNNSHTRIIICITNEWHV